MLYAFHEHPSFIWTMYLLIESTPDHCISNVKNCKEECLAESMAFLIDRQHIGPCCGLPPGMPHLVRTCGFLDHMLAQVLALSFIIFKIPEGCEDIFPVCFTQFCCAFKLALCTIDWMKQTNFHGFALCTLVSLLTQSKLFSLAFPPYLWDGHTFPWQTFFPWPICGTFSRRQDNWWINVSSYLSLTSLSLSEWCPCCSPSVVCWQAWKGTQLS